MTDCSYHEVIEFDKACPGPCFWSCLFLHVHGDCGNVVQNQIQSTMFHGVICNIAWQTDSLLRDLHILEDLFRFD